MKKYILAFSFAALSFACGGGNTANNTARNTISVAPDTNNASVVSSHPTENSATLDSSLVPRSDTKSKWTQGGEPLDTTAYDAAIKKAEQKMKANPKDEAVKKSVGEFYLKRAVELTEVRQYASALGDYRRVLKYDPDNEEAKNWIDQITKIYAGMNREAPPEGAEPPPLPFKKQTK